MKTHAARHHAPTNAARTHGQPCLQTSKLRRQRRRGRRGTTNEEMSEQKVFPMAWAEELRARHTNLVGSGKKLPTDLARTMGQAYGSDFKAVKIFQDSAVATGIGAYAFARGSEIHFAPGMYEPATTKGRELIGHELGHVVQQGADSQAVTPSDRSWAVQQHSGLESAADRAGKKAARGESARSHIAHGGPGAKAGAIQGYFKQGTFSVANDLSFGAESGFRSLYAKGPTVESANKKLAAVSSKIELIKGTGTQDFWRHKAKKKKEAPVTLENYTIRNKANPEGEQSKTWADCGKTAQLVMGGDSKTAVTAGKDGTKASYSYTWSPIEIKINSMKDWLNARLVNPDVSNDKKAEIKATFKAIEAPEAELNKKLAEGTTEPKKWNDPTFASEVEQLGYRIADRLWKNNTRAFDADIAPVENAMGINKQAHADVGEGYMILSSGYNAPISVGMQAAYNYHFAGVVLASDDGKDQVTLENFTTNDPAEQNTSWKFKVYGSEYEQNFHDSNSMNFGYNPITYKVKGESQ